MRKWINIILETTDTVTSEETKFWYSSVENKFVDHDIDTHHVKMAAQEPELFGLSHEEVAHHPHASGEYDSGDEGEYEDDDFDPEEWADNNDMGIFANLFGKGWVRGGHEIDVMTYHEFGEIRHEGGIYLQGAGIRPLRKCVAACVARWPDIEYFRLELGQQYFELRGEEATRMFIKFGKIPS